MLVGVTGGTGFVGSHTVAALQDAGHRVRALVRSPEKVKKIYEPRGRAVDEVVIGDMTDPASAARLLEGCDAIVHAAALVALEARRAREVHATNVRGAKLVVGGAVERGQRVLYVSSAGALFTRGSEKLTHESSIGESRSAYGASKAEAEQYVRSLQDRGADILTTYPTAVVGPDDPNFTDPNRALGLLVQWGGPLTTSGYQPVDVRDLAALHIRMLEDPSTRGCYVAAGPYYPWADLLNEVERVTGRKIRRFRVSGGILRGIGRLADFAKWFVDFDLPFTHEGMVFGTCWAMADGEHARRAFGLEYRSLEQTLADTYRWMVRAGHLRPEQIGKLALPHPR